MLKATCNGNTGLALNDVVVSRGDYSHSIDLAVSVNEESLGRYIADGFIVSTSTGSTGYSLSAGGPIVAPGLDCTILTPVCAHSLLNKAVVISPDCAVTVRLNREGSFRAAVSCDGREPFFLGNGEEVCITRAEEKVRFIRFNNIPFFERVRSKLNFPVG